VIPTSGAVGYKAGTVVQLTAKPDTGWKFVKWEGDLSGTDNPVQINVKEPKEVTAVFTGMFYLSKNGVTIKCPDAEFGDSGTVNGVTYTKRKKDQINSTNVTTTCTSGITDMSSMFYGASSFNQDVSSWDVSKITNMRGMFRGASSFNQNISSWNVGNVTDMGFMLQDASSFNQDISDWDVSNVTDMERMFDGASAFNQDISGWCVKHIPFEPDHFSAGSALTKDHEPVWGTCPDK
jgi:surface protein